MGTPSNASTRMNRIPIFDTTHLVPRLLRVAVALIIWVLGSTAMILASKFAEFHRAHGDRLPDFVLDNLPHVPHDELVVQSFLAASMLSGFLRMLTSRRGLRIMTRALLCMSVLYVLRACTLIGTQYPDPRAVPLQVHVLGLVESWSHHFG